MTEFPERTRKTRRKDYYVLFVYGDVEPELQGPFPTEDERDERAKALKREHGDEHGIFALDAPKGAAPEVFAYSHGFFRGRFEESEPPVSDDERSRGPRRV